MNLLPNRRTVVRGLLAAGAGAASGPFFIRNAFAQTPAYTLKMSSSSPANMPIIALFKDAADKIKTESNGQVELQIFPASQLGTDDETLTQIRTGAIDLLSVSGTILSVLQPITALQGVAFAFPDYAHVWRAMDGDVGTQIKGGMIKMGLQPFERAMDVGLRQITSNTHPIATAADLQGFKIRSPQSPLYLSMWKGLSASPVALSFGQTYQSLQTKLIDGQENSLAVISGAKFYEVQKYCSITNHAWEGVWTVVNPDKWGKLPKNVQDVVHKNVMGIVEPQRKAMAELNSSIEADLKSKGLAFNVAEAETFRAALARAGYYGEWRGKFGPEAWRALEKYSGPLG